MSVDWRNLPSLAALRAFDATARHGGFAGAARSLNVTHAAVAQQVRALEKDLGLQLAVRSGRTVGLTEAGMRLAAGLDKGFGAIFDCITELCETEARRGLRVTTTTFIADSVIVPRLSEFWNMHPGVEIALQPSREYVDILRDGFDFAIRAILVGAKADQPGMEAIHLSSARVVGVGAPDIVGPAAGAAADYPWLWHEGMASKLAMMRDCGLDVAALRQVRIGGPSLLLEAARQGLGVTVFNERIVREDLATGRLREVPLPRELRAEYYIIIPKGPRRPIVDDFVYWLKTLF
jgi:LysR family glycine cleavage system transcriptional activator